MRYEISDIKPLATIPLNIVRYNLDCSLTPDRVQDRIIDHVRHTGWSVVGHLAPDVSSITLMRWPETRLNQFEPTPTEPQWERSCDQLTPRLGAITRHSGIVRPGTVHVMMGRLLDGYDPKAPTAPLSAFGDLLPYTMPGIMVSANRTLAGEVIPHTEKVGVINTVAAHIPRILRLAIDLQQHHVVIEHGGDRTEPDAPVAQRVKPHTTIYETPFARPKQQ